NRVAGNDPSAACWVCRHEELRNGGAEEGASSAFLCRSRQSRKLGSGGDGPSSTVGRNAARGFSVLARSSWFLLSFVLRTFHPKKQQLPPLPQETPFLEFSMLGTSRRLWYLRQRFAGQSFLNQPGYQICKRNNVLADTRFFEGVHIGVAVADGYDGPRVSSRRHHRVHQETPEPTVAVHIRMDVDEQEMPEHNAHCWVGLSAQQIEERRHGVPHRLVVRRHMHGLPDINLAVAIAGKVGAFQQADGDARREQFAVPSPVILVRNLASILAMQTPADAFLYGLVGLPVAARRLCVPLLAVAFIGVRIPGTGADAFNQLGRNPIALDRQ